MPTAASLLLVWLVFIYALQILGDPPNNRIPLHLPTYTPEGKEDISISISSILSLNSSLVVLISMAFGVLAVLEAMNLKFGGSKEQDQHHKPGNQKQDLEIELKESERVLERTKGEVQELWEELEALEDRDRTSAPIVEGPKTTRSTQLDHDQAHATWMEEHQKIIEGLEAKVKETDEYNERIGKETQKIRKNIDAFLADRDRTSASTLETPKNAQSIQLERDQARAALAKANHIIHVLRGKEILLENAKKMGEAREQRLHEELDRLESAEYLQSLKLTWQLEYIETTAKKETEAWQQKFDSIDASDNRFEQSLQRLQQQIDSIIKDKKGSSGAMQLKAPCGCTFSPEERAKFYAAELQQLYDQARALLQSRQPLAEAIREKLNETRDTAEKARAIIDEFGTGPERKRAGLSTIAT